MFYIDLVYRCE